MKSSAIRWWIDRDRFNQVNTGLTVTFGRAGCQSAILMKQKSKTKTNNQFGVFVFFYTFFFLLTIFFCILIVSWLVSVNFKFFVIKRISIEDVPCDLFFFIQMYAPTWFAILNDSVCFSEVDERRVVFLKCKSIRFHLNFPKFFSNSFFFFSFFFCSTS